MAVLVPGQREYVTVSPRQPPPRPCPTVKALSARPLLKISQGETEAMPAMQLRVAKKKKSKSSCKEFNTLFYLLSLSQITSVFVL